MKAIKQNPLIVFFLLTFAIAWAMWIPAALSKLSGGSSVLGPDNPLIGGLGRFAPGIAAVLVAAALAGRRGIKDLVRPAGIWRVSIGWYAVAFLFEPAIVLVSGWLDALLGIPAPPSSLQNPTPYPILCVIPILLIYSLPGAFGEELGWRGFALPRLQNTVNAVIASAILGIAWGICTSRCWSITARPGGQSSC
jgi:membrane protease YdiL (CAAX protease family)